MIEFIDGKLTKIWGTWQLHDFRTVSFFAGKHRVQKWRGGFLFLTRRLWWDPIIHCNSIFNGFFPSLETSFNFYFNKKKRSGAGYGRWIKNLIQNFFDIGVTCYKRCTCGLILDPYLEQLNKFNILGDLVFKWQTGDPSFLNFKPPSPNPLGKNK